jgi:hypothetical protein
MSKKNQDIIDKLHLFLKFDINETIQIQKLKVINKIISE